MPVLHTEPHIEIINDFLTPEECQHFITIAKDRLSRAQVTGDNGGYVMNRRTGFNGWLAHNTDSTTRSVAERIANYVCMPLENAEQFQVIHYSPTQHYDVHFDGWKLNDSAESRKNLSTGGQRMITCLVYLNEPIRGGTTDFPKLNLSVTPKIGKLLIFHNVYPGTNTLHPNSLHTGRPVLEGEKYAFNLWFRQQSLSTPFTYDA